MNFISLSDTQIAFEEPPRAKSKPHLWINSSNLRRDQQPILHFCLAFSSLPTAAPKLLLFSFLVGEHLLPNTRPSRYTTLCPDSGLPCAVLAVPVPQALGWGTSSSVVSTHPTWKLSMPTSDTSASTLLNFPVTRICTPLQISALRTMPVTPLKSSLSQTTNS